MILKTLPQLFTVSKVTDYAGIDLSTEYVFTGSTAEEKSLVCPTLSVPTGVLSREDNWRGFYVSGQLDFSLIGILSEISGILAKEKIGIFVVSTYNTDYVFVKENNFMSALGALKRAGYTVAD